MPDGEVELRHEPPIAWQETPAGPQPVRVQFRRVGERGYGFVAATLDPAFATVVDPGVVWGTYLGGGATDSINAMRWVPGSGVWVAGWAGSTDFPTTPGAYRTTGGADAFLARLADNGATLLSATYLGGSLGDEVRGLDLGPGDTPTVVGFTRSTNFPTTVGALQPSFGGSSPFLDIGDAFVVRFNAAGSALLAASYLGGIYDDIAEAVRVDAAGNATVVGWSSSPNYPTTPGSYQPAISGIPGLQSDGFITRVSATGQTALFSTYLGGQASEQLLAVDREPSTGDWVVGGWTLGADYPVTSSAYRTASSGGIDQILTRLTAGGGGVVFSTYLGGGASDVIQTLRVANDGSVWTAGFTQSTNFPTTLNAPQRVFAGQLDGTVAQLSGNGQLLLFATLLGGVGPEKVRGIDVAAAGVAVVGEAGLGFPLTPDAVQSQFLGGNLDGFVSFYTGGGTSLAFSSYLGGANQDSLASVQLSDGGLAVVAGWTFSSNFPVAPAGYQSSSRGVEDGVALQLDLLASLGDGLEITPDPTAAPSTWVVGDSELLGATVANRTQRELVLDAITVLVAGAGDTSGLVGAVRVERVDAGAAPVVVGGPLPLAGDNRETTIPLQGMLLAPAASTRLRVVANVPNLPTDSVELAAAIVDGSSWAVRALGAGSGPAVRVLGSGRVEGPLRLVGRLPGDADGDGLRTVLDVRRLLGSLGAVDRIADADGDGLLSLADVAATRGVVLGRATVHRVPPSVVRGEWFTIGVVLPELGTVQASLGGRSLRVGRVTAREITLQVDAAQSLGTQELLLSSGGRQLVGQFVVVQ
jgi:hypothetical protein